MNDVVIVAIISLIGTLGGTFGGILTSTKLTNYRLEQLEKKVEAHNKVVERTYRLEEEQKVEEEKIKVINHRIEDLEKYHR
ncbi:MAG: hypothetical protein IIX36_06655 [Clostridia bacterium]|nr:hypothetical protein [Clostridia bacterium]